MGGKKCAQCGDELELVPKPRRARWHVIPECRFPLEIVNPFVCKACGCEVRYETQFRYTDGHIVLNEITQGQPAPAPERKEFSIRDRDASLVYLGAFIPGSNLLFPVQEGRLQVRDNNIDQYGDPDLMVKFASEYLKQYWVIVPKGRLPQTMVEIAPALNLLVNAAELAMKADLVRSDELGRGHTLGTLYSRLKDEHRKEIENRFANSAVNANLKSIGIKCPMVESILGVYDEGFFGNSVYRETRYFAEPTEMLKSEWKGMNLPALTVYPFFLPAVVQSIIETYYFFSGAERLMRMGADVIYGLCDRGRDQHGDGGLVPSSAGLVVIRFAQHIAWDKKNKDRDVFIRFKAARPFGHEMSHRYGGKTFLFYRVGKNHPEDGETVIDGLECKVWYTGRLAMHSRDLYRLADALETSGGFPVLEIHP